MKGTPRSLIVAGTLLALCGLVTAGEPRVWSDPDQEFTKEDWADWRDPVNQDRITDGVRLTRQDGQGLFNIAEEESYGLTPSPAGTEWADGSAADWSGLQFMPWRDWAYRPPDSVGRKAVLHLIEKDVYIDIQFLSWTQGGNGGGFSYERATEGTPGEKVWTGATTTFTKADYADFTDPANQDRIATGIWITRQDDRGLFNIARENSYDCRLGDRGPPAGTEWAWGKAADWQSLVFSSWYEWHGDNPPGAVGKSAVLHLVEADVYLDIKFLSWTQGNNGGGFSYERATQGVAGEKVWTGAKTTFTKEDYAFFAEPDSQDRITSGVWLTRADKEGLFNFAREPGYYWDPDAVSPPTGTEWAYGTTADLANLRFQNWYDWQDRDPRGTVGRDAVLHLVEEDVFLDIKFLSWTGSASGGGFSYERATPASAGQRIWTGPKTTFTKADWADWRDPANQDRITDRVWITRQNQQGIFNFASEPGYYWSHESPALTEWAYGKAADWESLGFQSWRNFAYPPPASVGRDAVLHLLKEDVYLDIKFLSWTDDADGGGFSYERATEGTPGEKVWTGTRKTFAKANYADFGAAENQDRITDSVWITRQDRRGIFNIAREPYFGFYPYAPDRSPRGTEWAWGRASEWQSLRFYRWRAWHGGSTMGGPTSTVGRSAVLHLLEEDVYIDVRFLHWTDGSDGGGFSYERATEGTAGEKVWSGPKTTFIRPDFADWYEAASQDRITDDVWITRKYDQGIFNIARERGYYDDYEGDGSPAPSGTEWAWGSAAQWRDLTFRPWSEWNEGDPGKMLGRKAVVHLVEDDIYIDIRFLRWTEDNDGIPGGGGFSYIRGANSSPAVGSGPTASPTLAMPGDTISFSVVASDPEGDPLTFSWTFGDGGSATGASVTHAYAAAGEYTATVTVGDGVYSVARTVGVKVALPLAMVKTQGKVNYKVPYKDGLKMQGTLGLPQGFLPDGKAFRLDAGGVVADFTMDAKGKGLTTDGYGKLALKYDAKRAAWLFTVTLKSGQFATAWADEGMVNADIMIPVEMHVEAVVDGTTFFQDAGYNWKCKKDKAGSLK